MLIKKHWNFPKNFWHTYFVIKEYWKLNKNYMATIWLLMLNICSRSQFNVKNVNTYFNTKVILFVSKFKDLIIFATGSFWTFASLTISSISSQSIWLATALLIVIIALSTCKNIKNLKWADFLHFNIDCFIETQQQLGINDP